MTTDVNIDFSTGNTTLTDVGASSSVYQLNHRLYPDGVSAFDFSGFFNQTGTVITDYEATLTDGELLMELKTASDGGTQGRLQMDIYPDTEACYTTQRMKFMPSMASFESYNTLTWFVVNEMRVGLLGVDDHRFRITTDLVSVSNQMFLVVTGSYKSVTPPDDTWEILWSAPVVAQPIPINEWFKLRMFLRVGDSSTGRFIAKFQKDGQAPVTLADVRNQTFNPRSTAVNIKHLNPLKLYTNNGVIDYVNGEGGTLAVSCSNLQLWVA